MREKASLELEKQFKQLSREVQQVKDVIKGKAETDNRINEIYKGTMILYSNLIDNPDFMFIGINPGAGYYNETNNIEKRIDFRPINEFEYVTSEGENWDYSLAKETRDVFKKSKYYNKFSRSVKTNVIFTSTHNIVDYEKLYSLLIEEYEINMYQYAKKWIIELIGMVKPKVIICEGAKAFNFLSEWYSIQFSWVNNIAKGTLVDGITFIAYKRNHSHILNREGLLTRINSLRL